jgi:hypothetical protein
MPTFVQAGWKKRFIPTLIHCLMSTPNAWDIGQGVDVVVTIQGVLDKVYPHLGYHIMLGDKIYSMVCAL